MSFFFFIFCICVVKVTSFVLMLNGKRFEPIFYGLCDVAITCMTLATTAGQHSVKFVFIPLLGESL